jgi:hypothetical protein
MSTRLRLIGYVRAGDVHRRRPDAAWNRLRAGPEDQRASRWAGLRPAHPPSELPSVRCQPVALP